MDPALEMEILFELSVSIEADGSLDACVMRFLRRVLRLMSGKGGAIWRLYSEPGRLVAEPCQVFLLPKNLAAYPNYSNFINELRVNPHLAGSARALGGRFPLPPGEPWGAEHNPTGPVAHSPPGLLNDLLQSPCCFALGADWAYSFPIYGFGIFLFFRSRNLGPLPIGVMHAMPTLLERLGRALRAYLVEQQLREEQQRLQLATSTAELGVWEWDGYSGHVAWDARMLQMYGVRAQDFPGSFGFWLQRIHADDRVGFERKLYRALHKSEGVTADFRILHGDGSTRYQTARASILPATAGRPTRLLGVCSDTTRLRAHEAELYRIAYFDALTGLPNRQLLLERLRRLIAQASRGGELLVVCYIDLDNFKPLNDDFGHAAGDSVLVEIARRLSDLLGAMDVAARVGGDEFVLLLAELGSEEQYRRAIGKILAEIQRPVQFEGRTAALSASIGVTVFPLDAVDPDTLLRHADQAMHVAKSVGRNGYHLYDSGLEEKAEEQRSAYQRILLGIQKNEFVLYYQPKVDLVTGTVVGFEALIRWLDPENGLLPPDAFLPFVRGTELEEILGDYVLNLALDQLSRWIVQGLNVPISVNISPEHLLQDGFIDKVRKALSSHPVVNADQLEFEILESAAINDMDRAIEILIQCRKMGIRLSLDDFGTGYSSLNYFRRLPIDVLKIDKSFVRDMLTDANDRGIVESVVRLAQTFDREVIAEGVETLEHAAALLSVGCTIVQGYGIAKPMPADAVWDWLRDWHKKRLWEQIWPKG